MQSVKMAAVVGLLCAVVVARGAELGEPEQPAQYEFNYAVNDPVTGDLKDQQESRDGDAVVGYYRTADADGLVRTVKYRADGVNGFQAEVVREPVAAVAGVTVAAKAAVPVKAADPVKPAAVVPVAPAAAPVLPYYYGYQPYAGYGYQPYAGYGYQPYAGYGYQPYSAYGYQPYSAYGYQPYAAYGYQPYSYPYVNGKYAPLAAAVADRK